jgi:putative tryptophan/tyrosine transport system substrate-binding protein
MQFDQLKRREFITLLGGAAVTRPLAARAQQPAMPVIGFLGSSSPTERASMLTAFREGLTEAGYVEGKNVVIEYRWAEGQYYRLPTLAAELVRLQVTLIAASDGPSALAAKAATTTIPIVFSTGGDPVQIGLVTSLNRPGGNLTGVNLIAGPLPAKRFGLLHELVPAAKTIALLINPNNANAEGDTATVLEAARVTGAQILVMKAVTESDFKTVFASLVQERAGGLLVNSDIFFTSQRDQLIALAVRHAVPAIYAWREFSVAGGLISYGPNLSAALHQVAIYTGRILKGAKPADLPVLQPTEFELVINMKTAKALGLTIPPGVLAIADVVIE